MLRSTSIRFRFVLSALALLGLAAPMAGASTYTTTDLGAGAAKLGGNGTILTPDGLYAYAFPKINNAIPSSTVTSSGATDPRGDYSIVPSNGLFLNQNGVFVGSNVYGVTTGSNPGGGSSVYSASKQTDGTYGALTTLWQSPNNAQSGGPVALALDLNNLNQVLGVTSPYSGTTDKQTYLLYNLKANSATDLSTLLPSGWHLDVPISIDDQGRILVAADSGAGSAVHALLLTPDGVTSNAVPTPEPSTLATLAVAAAGLLIQRRRRSRAARA